MRSAYHRREAEGNGVKQPAASIAAVAADVEAQQQHAPHVAMWRALCRRYGWPLVPLRRLHGPKGVELAAAELGVDKHVLLRVLRGGPITAHLEAALAGLDRWEWRMLNEDEQAAMARERIAAWAKAGPVRVGHGNMAREIERARKARAA